MLSSGRHRRNKLQKSVCSTDSGSALCFKMAMINNITYISNSLQTPVVDEVQSIVLWICHFKVDISNSPYKAFVNKDYKMIFNRAERMNNQWDCPW